MVRSGRGLAENGGKEITGSVSEEEDCSIIYKDLRFM